jgi:HSP20 family protein
MVNLLVRDPFRNLFTLPSWDEEWEEFQPQRGLKIYATDKDIIAEAVVAGVPAENIEIEIENGVLTIKAETKEEKKTKGEYRASSFKYYYTTALSGGDWHKATAEVKNGIVTVTIPKTEEARPKKITVKAKESK